MTHGIRFYNEIFYNYGLIDKKKNSDEKRRPMDSAIYRYG